MKKSAPVKHKCEAMFAALPEEIIRYTLKYYETKELHRWLRVSKTWNNIVIRQIAINHSNAQPSTKFTVTTNLNVDDIPAIEFSSHNGFNNWGTYSVKRRLITKQAFFGLPVLELPHDLFGEEINEHVFSVASLSREIYAEKEIRGVPAHIGRRWDIRHRYIFITRYNTLVTVQISKRLTDPAWFREKYELKDNNFQEKKACITM
jgi:hypothetical protein